MSGSRDCDSSFLLYQQRINPNREAESKLSSGRSQATQTELLGQETRHKPETINIVLTINKPVQK